MPVRHVGDILQEKSEEIVWIGPLESVFDALKLMNEKDVGSVLVQIDGYLVGILPSAITCARSFWTSTLRKRPRCRK